MMACEQRFPLDTLITKHFNGFEQPFRGAVKHFNAQNGVYDVDYEDGDSEQMTEQMVAQCLVDPQLKRVYDQEQLALRNALVGRTVMKSVTSYEGVQTQLVGTVTRYNPATWGFAIEYPSVAFTEELDLEELQTRLARPPPLPSKRSQPTAAPEQLLVSPVSTKRKLPDGDGPGDHQGLEILDGLALDDTNRTSANAATATATATATASAAAALIRDEEEQDCDPSLLFVNEKYPTRNQAYAVLRKVLRVILEQEQLKKFRSTHQLQYLINDSMRAKTALTAFVESGGLQVLNNCLRLWFKTTNCHQGVLVVLKVLVVLPGVTPPLVVKSGIGKTLQFMATITQEMPFVDPRVGDVAQLVIETWKKQARQKHVSSSIKDLIQSHQSVTMETRMLPLAKPNRSKREEATKAIAERMFALLKPAAATTKKHRGDVAGNDAQTLPHPHSSPGDVLDASLAFFSGKMFDLGASVARHKLEKKRQVIIEETVISRTQQQVSLASRINQQHMETLKKANSQDQALDYAKEEEIPEGRIRFGRPNMCVFDANEPIETLFRNSKTTRLAPPRINATIHKSNSSTTSSSHSSSSIPSKASMTKPKSILKESTIRSDEPLW